MSVTKSACAVTLAWTKTPRAWLLVALAFAGCDIAYPEIIVVNTTDERVLLRNVSYSGCFWSRVLAYSEATPPQRCAPGMDKVHFQKFDAARYCERQAQDGALDGICACDKGAVAPPDPGLIQKVPLWFNYETVSKHHSDYGDFLRIEISLTDMEQDFSIPGPYGH